MIENLIKAKDKDVKKFLLFGKRRPNRINTIWDELMPDVDSIQRYFPLIQSNAEKLFIASTLDALRDKGYVPWT